MIAPCRALVLRLLDVPHPHPELGAVLPDHLPMGRARNDVRHLRRVDVPVEEDDVAGGEELVDRPGPVRLER